MFLPLPFNRFINEAQEVRLMFLNKPHQMWILLTQLLEHRLQITHITVQACLKMLGANKLIIAYNIPYLQYLRIGLHHCSKGLELLMKKDMKL